MLLLWLTTMALTQGLGFGLSGSKLWASGFTLMSLTACPSGGSTSDSCRPPAPPSDTLQGDEHTVTTMTNLSQAARSCQVDRVNSISQASCISQTSTRALTLIYYFRHQPAPTPCRAAMPWTTCKSSELALVEATQHLLQTQVHFFFSFLSFLSFCYELLRQ